MPVEFDPIYVDSLEALAVPIDDMTPAWDDVIMRARRPPRTRALRMGALVATLAVAVVVVGSAFGLRLTSIIDFGNSPSAPAAVEHSFAEFDLGSPPEIAPGAIASQTRVITSPEVSSSGQTLYVSPTKQGGFCYEWTAAAGGCDEFGTTPLNIVWSSQIAGTVASAYVATVKIAFKDGTTVQPGITWISEPINAGFFLYTIPPDETVSQVDGYDANGVLVSRQRPGQPLLESNSPPEFALTSQERVALKVETPNGTATAYTAPSTTAGTCAWFELAGTDALIYGYDGCMPHNYTPQGIAFRYVHIGNSVLLAGAAAPRYERLTLQFPDGSTATVKPTSQGLILYSLPPKFTNGDVTVTVTAYQPDGQVIFTHPTTDAEPVTPAPPPGNTTAETP